jgi:hypothetical protein
VLARGRSAADETRPGIFPHAAVAAPRDRALAPVSPLQSRGVRGFRLRRTWGRLRRRIGGAPPAPPIVGDSDALFGSAGFVLTTPLDDAKGVYLVNGKRLREFEVIASDVRRSYVVVLTHWWELGEERLREYRRNAALFDCVVSPDRDWDRKLGFAPIYRSNSLDLFVDDTMWPLLDLPRDVDVVESVSVPWVHKRPRAWLDHVRAYLDRRGGGRAVYMTKREPTDKEDDACHREWGRFLADAASDTRIEVRVGSSQQDVVELYNRARFLYHPSWSDFGPRCIIEALYCGAIVVIGKFPWSGTATATPELWQRIVVRNGLEDLPEHSVVDVREWQTARGVREGLLEFLSEGHVVNTEIEPFSMFSSTRVTRPADAAERGQ